MSQQGLLEEMSEWTPETCRNELHSALPRLLSLYQRSDDWGEQMRVLMILTQMFLPHVSLLELERNFFSQVIPKAVKLFDDLLCELSSQASGLTSQNAELQKTLRTILQTLGQGLETLTTCVHHVCNLDEAVALDNIQTLPTSVLHVLRSMFTHCRDSEYVYSGRLHMVSDLLQSVFKEAVFLHKQLMELMDKVCIDSSATEEEIRDMVAVLHTVLELCAVISSMDHALHANTWKFIIKQSLKHQALVENQLRHNDIVNRLSDDILASYHSCLCLAEHMKLSGTQEITDHRLFQKTAKLCRFFANSLVHYIKEFMPFLSESCCRLHQLYLQIHSKFPPGLNAIAMSEVHRDEMASVFLVALDPLIDQFISFQPFVEQVLKETLDLPSDLFLPQCLLLIHIMDKLPSQSEDVQTLWCTGTEFADKSSNPSIFKAVFYSFQQCSAELSLPVRLQGAILNGGAPVEMTLYQFVCIHLCAYIASILPSNFSYLEYALLDAVLSPSMLTSLLAMDSWCFLARYGTAELCAHHVSLLAHLIKTCPGDCCQLYNLSVLLRRLLFLMASEHQIEFIREFPVEETENMTVWQHVSLKSFKTDLRKKVTNDMISGGITLCRRWLNDQYTNGNFEQLNTSLSALQAVCNTRDEYLEPNQQFAVSEVIGHIWALLDLKKVSSQPYLQKTVSLLVPLLGIYTQYLETHITIQVVSLAASFLQLDPPDHVHFAVLFFLVCLGKVFISQDMQGQVLPKLSALFAALLSSHSWLIHQHALEAFTQFAEETRHEDVVPQSLCSEEVKGKVVNFLNKMNSSAETEEFRLSRIKQEKNVIQKYFLQKELIDGREEVLTAKPSAKRARHEYPHSKQYELQTEAAEAALKALLSLLQKSPAPDWLSQRLHDLETLLISLKGQANCS
ncbi:FIGNL1-interacting regulator of recombination and mitosis isoform X1 [Pleurodeles waltl]|uniref:FIGNL1-interacting regulator of recombination and mitosis isoform X1 n=1 Tax=Pleurodeles waltl TaxID=8319 RepID=UPI003709AE4C